LRSGRAKADATPDDGGFEQIKTEDNAADAGFSRSSDRKAAGSGKSAGKSGSSFGSSFRKKGPVVDDSGFTRSSEQPVRKRAAAPVAEPVVVDGVADDFTRSSQQHTQKKVPKAGGPTLKARAADYLSRREHSRFELARKLGRWSDNREEIEAVLDALTREGWMSTARFVQSVVHRRAPRQGTSRIVQELRQHGIDSTEIAAVKPDLQASEFVRAQTVWHKRFGAAPPDREAWAKQARFLAARGFTHDVIRRVLGGEEDEL
jgi:regulatory protein